nr:histone acetyltransferase HAC1-like isoform X3 [Tanacetum cinerariifolium]
MGDRCHNWQHWICGLFNTETDKKKEADYICPKCRLTDIKDGKWVPQTLFRAKDLSRTNLSDHIEQRIFTRMKQEREDIAKSWGTELENVSEAVDLVVRVVRLEGVDACIFRMYVQEYGSQCDGSNNRCVYISYLDSVKYFQPQIKTASGESLRTFVYHEILFGYLEHFKKRGFAKCYIGSCPLLNGQDYIFFYFPETQKTPKEEKLRQWNIDCSYQDCQTIMRLLRHASRCSVMYARDYGPCKQAWWVLMKHVQIYTDLNCKILRCKEMKNHIEKNASSSKKKQNPTDEDE